MRDIPGQRQSLVCSAPCALFKGSFLAPHLLSQQLPAAGYPREWSCTWPLLDNNLPRRAAAALPSLCHLKAGVSGLGVKLEEGEEAPTGDRAMNSPSSVVTHRVLLRAQSHPFSAEIVLAYLLGVAAIICRIK